MGTYVVTGAESGIGAATAAMLRERGHRVIGVDRTPSDVTADLSTAAGRTNALAEIEALAGGRLNGFVACAGVAGMTGVDSRLVVSVNYFGAVELATGLRPLLAKAAAKGEPAAAVLLSSNSVTCMPGWALDAAKACRTGDEAKARAVAGKRDSVLVYPASKAALAWWGREAAVSADWAGAGIRLNLVAPGIVATPMTESVRKDPVFGPFADAYPTALKRSGRPEEIAATIAFLLSPEASLLVGTVVFADGGTDAMKNPKRPSGRYVPGPVMDLAMKAVAKRSARRRPAAG